jgi:hypothetical protein
MMSPDPGIRILYTATANEAPARKEGIYQTTGNNLK